MHEYTSTILKDLEMCSLRNRNQIFNSGPNLSYYNFRLGKIFETTIRNRIY
jgi:hypothetical protein